MFSKILLDYMKLDGGFFVWTKAPEDGATNLRLLISFTELECEGGMGDCDAIHQAQCAYKSFRSREEVRGQSQ